MFYIENDLASKWEEVSDTKRLKIDPKILNWKRKVFLESVNQVKKVEVSFDGFPMLGIWSMPSAPFVCIEPWMSCADIAGEKTEFEKKKGMILLEDGERYKCSYSIRLHHH